MSKQIFNIGANTPVIDTSANTAARTYTMQDRDGTVADLVDVQAAKVYADGLKGRNNQSAGRPTLLVFGNSIAGQSVRVLISSTTTVSTETKAGQTVIPVAASSGFSVNDAVAISVCSAGIHLDTVVAVDTVSAQKTITIGTKLPFLARANATVNKYTTSWPSVIRVTGGLVHVAVANLGGPVDLIPGYGYGGSTCKQMQYDIATWLRAMRPSYVAFHLWENEITAGTSASTMQSQARGFAKACIAHGATPIFFTPVPSDYYTAGAQVAAFDSLVSYLLNTLPTDVPGAVSIDLSTPWLDTGAPTLRKPISGWTDGIHPVPGKKATIANFALSALEETIGTLDSLADCAIESFDMSGTGGSTAGAGSITNNGVAAGWTITADAGVSVIASKTAGGAQRIQYSVAGASNVSTTQASLSRSPNMPGSVGGQWVKGYIKFKINAASQISIFQSLLQFSSGEQYTVWQDNGMGLDAGLIGNTYTVETTAARVPYGATTYTLHIALRPETLGSPSGVSADIEILEAGIIPSGSADVLPTTGT